MELAKVTSQGQITIPAEIRRYLELKAGDKVVLIKEAGYVIMANSHLLELKDGQWSPSDHKGTKATDEDEDAAAFIGAHRRE